MTKQKLTRLSGLFKGVLDYKKSEVDYNKLVDKYPNLMSYPCAKEYSHKEYHKMYLEGNPPINVGETVELFTKDDEQWVRVVPMPKHTFDIKESTGSLCQEIILKEF